MKPVIRISMNFGLRKNDTALCNRLLWWEVLQYVNKINDYKFNIEFSNEFSDIEKYLYFPNTENKNKRYLIFQETEKPTKIIDYELINSLLSKETKLDINFNYVTNFDFLILDELKFANDERPLRNITVKEKSDTLLFKDSKEFVCFHIRRGNGVTITEENIQSLPIEYQSEYRSITKEFLNKDEIYLFYEDILYFNIIDEILKLNPTQKFYISHDLPNNFYDYWKEKYPSLIYTSTDFENRFIDQTQTFRDIFDLFFISNSNFLITSPHSSWSRFATIYNDKSYFEIIEPINRIIEFYKNFTKL